MPKEIAPPKVTGGGGFSFEDQVAAYFLAHLLSGQPLPMQPLGTISRIDFQARADGWLLDDMVLTLQWQGRLRRCTLSVKSNTQFTAKRAPAEFVQAAWEQFLQIGTDRFIVEQDLLGGVIAPLAPQLSTSLQNLLRFAREQDPHDLAVRIHRPRFASQVVRDLFQSFACPPALAATHGVTAEQTGALLATITVLEADFDAAQSTWWGRSLLLCSNALHDSSAEQAAQLWGVLLDLARTTRPVAGYFDFAKLVARLRDAFSLKDQPQYRADWARLAEHTAATWTAHPTTIGGRVTLPRPEDQARLTGTAATARLTALVGASGCGKTSLAQLWAQQQAPGHVLWWNAAQFAQGDHAAFAHTLGLAHPLTETLQMLGAATAYLVIDGLDQVFDDQAFRTLAAILAALQLDTATSPWHCVLLCQTEEWPRVQLALARQRLAPSVLPLAEPTTAELAAVWEEFPALQPLRFHPDLQSLLRKPLVLDLLAHQVELGHTPPDPSHWIGEADLIEWFWQTVILGRPLGATRAQCLQALAERQADAGRTNTPLVDCTFCASDALNSLLADRICSIRDGQYLAFGHPRYGDWARQRLLVARLEPGAAAEQAHYLDAARRASPLWHRAIRLYGLYLIERQPDLQRWKEAVDTFAPGGAPGTLEQDLLLEAAIFAADPLPILERMWPDLRENRGHLLRRLLGRFLQVATLPDEEGLAMVRAMAPERTPQVAARLRTPNLPYWMPLLRFLFAHRTAVQELAPDMAAKILRMWLTCDDRDLPLRQEAGAFALELAEAALHPHPIPETALPTEHAAADVYLAVLAAAPEFPAAVAAWALMASGRTARPVEPAGAGAVRAAAPDETAAQSPRPDGAAGDDRPIPPGEEGPRYAADAAFRYVCLETLGLYPLIRQRPQVARDVLLALLIRPPDEHPSHITHPVEALDVLALEPIVTWRPAVYLQGPFLYFLQQHPAAGLDAIIRLVNFATERWVLMQHLLNEPPTAVQFAIAGAVRRWPGDDQVYFWYRNQSEELATVACALMALEKWLYDQIDADQPITPWIDIIARTARSTAFGGLLSAVGRKAPRLLTGSLQWLLAVPEFLIWEVEAQAVGVVDDALLPGWLYAHNRWLIPLAHEWNALAHRARSLDERALQLFLIDPATQAFLAQARSAWQQRLRTEPLPPDLQRQLALLIPRYDLANYHWLEGSDPPTARYIPPAAAQPLLDTTAAEARIALRYFPHVCKRGWETGQSPAGDNPQALWDDLQTWATTVPPQDPLLGATAGEDAVCAGIALLVRFHRDWLAARPDYEGWCWQHITTVLTHPPAAGALDIARERCDWRWDRWLARIVPTLWVEDPADRTRRSWIVLLATNRHYETVEILCAQAALLRDQLGPHFRQLQHFLLSWAVIRGQRRPSPPSAPGGPGWFRPLRRLTVVLAGARAHWRRRRHPSPAKAIAAFVEQRQPEEAPRWTRIMRSLAPPGPRQRYRRLPACDLHLITAMYRWLPAVTTATNEQERAEWVTFWQDTLHLLVDSLQPALGGPPRPGAVTDWDRWVLARVAGVILDLRPEEQPRTFWEPILALGPAGRPWVEEFLHQWLWGSLSAPPVPDAFLHEWRTMLEYARTAPGWNLAGRRASDLQRMWVQLWGMDARMGRLWGADHRRVVTALQDLYPQWATQPHLAPESVVALTLFLCRPATEPMRLAGLEWVEHATSQLGPPFWSEPQYQNTVIEFLMLC